MSSESDGIFEEWLNDRDRCLPVLCSCAESLLEKKHQGSQGQLSPPLGKSPEPFGLENVDEYANEIWIMLRKRGGKFREKVARSIGRGDSSSIMRDVRSMMRSLRAEKKRDKYYQQVRKVLSKAGGSFGYRVENGFGSYGSLAEEAVSIPHYHVIKGDNPGLYWPQVDPAQLRTTGAILELAMVFRTLLEADGRYGTEIRIPVQTLCGYIRQRWEVEYDVMIQEVSTQTCDGEEQPYYERMTAMNLDNAPGFSVEEDALRDMADRAAMYLDDRQQFLVLCLAEYCNLTQKEIAAVIGLSGPSGVNYRLKQVWPSLKFFLSLEEDLDRDAQELFMKMVLSNCKDEDCSRLKEEKAVKETRS